MTATSPPHTTTRTTTATSTITTTASTTTTMMSTRRMRRTNNRGLRHIRVSSLWYVFFSHLFFFILLMIFFTNVNLHIDINFLWWSAPPSLTMTMTTGRTQYTLWIQVCLFFYSLFIYFTNTEIYILGSYVTTTTQWRGLGLQVRAGPKCRLRSGTFFFSYLFSYFTNTNIYIMIRFICQSNNGHVSVFFMFICFFSTN